MAEKRKDVLARTPKPETRRDREKARHRAEILVAAERVLAERGYEGATMADIARAADFSVGSIYNFFRNKADLGEEVMVRIGEERVRIVEEEVLPLASDPERGLRRFVELWVRHHFEHDAFLRMSFEIQLRNGRREPPPRIRALMEAYRAACVRFFERAAATGRLRPLPPKDLATAFDGLCHHLLFLWSRERGRGGAAAEAEAREHVHGVVASLLLAVPPARG